MFQSRAGSVVGCEVPCDQSRTGSVLGCEVPCYQSRTAYVVGCEVPCYQSRAAYVVGCEVPYVIKAGQDLWWAAKFHVIKAGQHMWWAAKFDACRSAAKVSFYGVSVDIFVLWSINKCCQISWNFKISRFLLTSYNKILQKFLNWTLPEIFWDFEWSSSCNTYSCEISGWFVCFLTSHQLPRFLVNTLRWTYILYLCMDRTRHIAGSNQQRNSLCTIEADMGVKWWKIKL